MNESISKGLERTVLVIAAVIFVVSSVVLFSVFILNPPDIFRASDFVVTVCGISFFTLISTSVIGVVLYSCTWSYHWITEAFREEEKGNNWGRNIY